MTKRALTTIDLADLDAVTGGRRSSTSSGSSSSDDQILEAIEGLKDAILDLGRQQAQPRSSGLEMLLPLLMRQLGGVPGGGTGGVGGTGGFNCGTGGG